METVIFIENVSPKRTVVFGGSIKRLVVVEKAAGKGMKFKRDTINKVANLYFPYMLVPFSYLLFPVLEI